MKTLFTKHNLIFKFDAGTSRGVLKEKETWFIKIWEDDVNRFGVGECGPLKGLSIDDRSDFSNYIQEVCIKLQDVSLPPNEALCLELADKLVSDEFPAVKFGLEMALLDLLNMSERKIFNNKFLKGQPIPINGLVWMGNEDFMIEQIDKKIKEGYSCIKMKIGAIDFMQEIKILSYIRDRFDKSKLTLRVDANGAFTIEDAPEKLSILAKLDIHSIEQPIKAGQVEQMRELVKLNIIPVALDEELIGVSKRQDKINVLDDITPHYIILKPTLLGGIKSCRDWIELAEKRNIGWWITSALESNIGLNAIAQFTAEYPVTIPQGLGTGQLYHNNIDSPLEIEKGFIHYNVNKGFNLEGLRF